MDLRRRFELLTEDTDFEREHGVVANIHRSGNAVGLRTVRVPGGGVTKLVRVMQTNACSLTCGYCPTFAGGRVRRVALASEEIARIFMDLHRRARHIKLGHTREPSHWATCDSWVTRVAVWRRQGIGLITVTTKAGV
jgi:predicted DNA-binding helix-hairpin-helix protein